MAGSFTVCQWDARCWNAALVDYLKLAQTSQCSIDELATNLRRAWPVDCVQAASECGALGSDRAVFALRDRIRDATRRRTYDTSSYKVLVADARAALEAFCILHGVAGPLPAELWRATCQVFTSFMSADAGPRTPEGVKKNEVVVSKNAMTRLTRKLAAALEAAARNPASGLPRPKRFTMTPAQMAIVRRIHLEMPLVSFECLPKIIGLAVQMTFPDMTPEEIAAVLPSPTSLRNADTLMGDADAVELDRAINARVIHVSVDGANRGGDNFFKVAAWFNRATERPDVWALDSHVAGKTGEEAALAVADTLKGFDGTVASVVADNAAAMSSTMYAALKKVYPGLDFVGCDLHILNLMLEGPIAIAFGEPKMNEPSAVQAAYVLFALQKDWDDFKAMASFHFAPAPNPFTARMREPIATRWWTIAEGIEYILRHHDNIINFTTLMGDGLPSTRPRAMFVELALWCTSNAVMAQAHFIAAYCREFWGPEMTWSQAAVASTWPPGFRAAEMPARVASRREALAGLKSGWDSLQAFQPVLECLDKCDPAERKEFFKRAQAFFSKAEEKLEKHSSVHWEKEMAFVAIGHSDADTARACATKLVSGVLSKPPSLLPVWEDLEAFAGGEQMSVALRTFCEDYIFCKPTSTHRVEGFISQFGSVIHNKARQAPERSSRLHAGTINIVQRSRLAAELAAAAEDAADEHKHDGPGAAPLPKKRKKARVTRASNLAMLRHSAEHAQQVELPDGPAPRAAGRRAVSTASPFLQAVSKRKFIGLQGEAERRRSGRGKGKKRETMAAHLAANAGFLLYSRPAHTETVVEGSQLNGDSQL